MEWRIWSDGVEVDQEAHLTDDGWCTWGNVGVFSVFNCPEIRFHHLIVRVRWVVVAVVRTGAHFGGACRCSPGMHAV